MSSKLLGQFFLLLFAALIAFASLRSLYRYYNQNPAERDVEQPGKNREWLNKQKPVRNIVALIVALAFSVFIFTKTATDFARGPLFMPLSLVLVGAIAMATVVRGLATGKIMPMISRIPKEVDQASKPRRFWLSMAWNSLMGFFMLIMGFAATADAPTRQLEDTCFDKNGELQTQEVLAACDKLLAQPDRTESARSDWLESRAVALANDGQNRLAIADYTKSIEENPDNASAYYWRGLAFSALGEFDQALSDYDSAIFRDPLDASGYLHRGNLLSHLSRHDEAIAAFDKALQLRPADADALAGRGVAYASKNDRASAERDFAAATALQPDNRILLHGRVMLSMMDDDPPEALRRLAVALQRDPDDHWALFTRAAIYRKIGETGKASADEARLDRLQAVEADREPAA